MKRVRGRAASMRLVALSMAGKRRWRRKDDSPGERTTIAIEVLPAFCARPLLPAVSIGVALWFLRFGRRMCRRGRRDRRLRRKEGKIGQRSVTLHRRKGRKRGRKKRQDRRTFPMRSQSLLRSALAKW